MCENPPLTGEHEVERLKGMKWGEKTKYNYAKSLGVFFTWMKSKEEYHEMLTETGDLNENFRIKALLVFCAERKKVDKRTGKEKALGYSGLSRFQSSLNYYLNQHNLFLCKEDRKELSQFFSGVKKNTARERQTGEREMQEGKSELPYEVCYHLFISL